MGMRANHAGVEVMDENWNQIVTSSQPFHSHGWEYCRCVEAFDWVITAAPEVMSFLQRYIDIKNTAHNLVNVHYI